ncbi:hypothetical protein ACFV4K_00365 [Nocardia sp. NPDC059764]|uniref:hypothetical protein n=1 Tax=Nocardia sp. NPDC059764 TaxID=3346939 RepID=UPI00365ED8FD
MDPNTALTRIRGLIGENYSLSGQLDYDQNTAVRILFDLIDAVEDLDRWMSRGSSLPEEWMSQTRIDRVEPMMCCREPMAVFPTRMTDGSDTEVGRVILVWHCSECNHWEPYEPYPTEPDATVPNCLCGAAMFDVPVSQWDPSRFRLAWCSDCGLYETWGAEPLRRHGNDADDDQQQEPRS